MQGGAAGAHLLIGCPDPAPLPVLLWGSCGRRRPWLGLRRAL